MPINACVRYCVRMCHVLGCAAATVQKPPGSCQRHSLPPASGERGISQHAPAAQHVSQLMCCCTQHTSVLLVCCCTQTKHALTLALPRICNNQHVPRIQYATDPRRCILPIAKWLAPQTEIFDGLSVNAGRVERRHKKGFFIRHFATRGTRSTR